MQPTDYLAVTTRVTAEGTVYFGDEQLNGLIADHGVTFDAAGQGGDVNTMTVTFIVGNVIIEDPTP